MLRLLMLLVMSLGVAGLLACGNGDAPQPAAGGPPGAYPYTIVTTVGMVRDIVAEVAGEKAKVTALMGEGTDPHQYRASADDIKALRAADVVFYNGLLLEGKMSDALVKLANSGKPVVAVTEKISEQYLVYPEGSEGHADPHVWMDPAAWSKAVEVVAETLGRYDPANKTVYEKNAAAYQARLADLDAYARRVIATIPQKQRVVLTSHDAFNYFGKAYGLEVVGIQGLSTEGEAGNKRVAELVQFIVDRDLQAVFIESSVSEDYVKALLAGAEKQGKVVRIGGMLYSDAMGPPGTYRGTYLGMMDHNVTTVTRALGGDAPEGGWQGKLSN